MARTLRLFAVLLTLVFASSLCRVCAQVTTGLPPFSTLQHNGTDTINLANLNIHVDIPVFSKAGRGLNFNFQFSFDSSIWQPQSAGQAMYWQMTNNSMITGTYAPWSRLLAGKVVEIQKLVRSCTGTNLYYVSFTYFDSLGTPHAFPRANSYYGCGTNFTPSTTTTPDGSGFTLTANSISDQTVYDKSGTQIHTYLLTDRNGNQMAMNVNGTTTTFYDTLSSTAPVLTITKNGNSNQITYTAPSGASPTYTVKYGTYTIQTKFGCNSNSVNEYGPLSGALLSEIDLPDGSKYSLTYEQTPGVPGNVTGRLASITYPTGGTISYKYVGANYGINCIDGSTIGLQRTTPDTGSNYWNYVQSQRGGTQATTTTITDPQGNNTVIQFQSGLEIQRQVYQGAISSSNLLLTTTTCYQSSTSCVSTFQLPSPFLGRKVTTQLPGSNNLTAQHIENDDAYGNVTGTQDYDYGSGAPGSPLRSTSTTYATLTNIQAFPQLTTVSDGQGNLVQKTAYNYGDTVTPSTGTPQHTSPPGSRGNLLNANYYTSSSSYLTRSYTYLDTGTVQTSTDVNGAVTTNLYPDATSTCGNAFPTTVNEPLSMTKSFTWNCVGGVATAVKDENGNSTTTTYNDPYYWRPASISYPGGGQTSWNYNSPTSTTTIVKLNASQNVVDTTLLDSLGRLSQEQLSAPEGVIYTSTAYDSIGRISSVSNPYLTTSDPTYGLRTYQYDALSRVTKVIPPDGSSSSNNVSTTYSNNCSATADQAGKARKSCLNGLGYLKQVFEDPSGLNYETDYTVDPLGNILNVSQKGGAGSSNWRNRFYSYDFLSRLTLSTNPESGTISYYYDANPYAGDLTSRVAPAPNQTGSSTVTTTYTYDLLHRLKGKSYSDGSTPAASYSYDQQAPWGWNLSNYIGRLTTEGTAALGNVPQTAMLYSYDPMGRVGVREQCQPQNCSGAPSLAVVSNYDNVGNVISLETSQSGVFDVTYAYSYDTAARLTSVASNFVDSQHPATLASVDRTLGYYPHGALRKMTLGNGLTQTAAFNSTLERCRINLNSSGTALGTCADATPSGNLLDLAAGFSAGTANNGDVTAWNAVGQLAFNRIYSYDSVNRLSSMSDSNSSQACKGLTWTYDAWSNRTDQNNTAGSCYIFHASAGTNNQFGSPYQYDSAGNMTFDGSHHYYYDAENRLIQVDGSLGTCSTGAACYVYDADNHRAVKIVSGGWLDYLYDPNGKIMAETKASGWATGYIYLSEQIIAQYSNSTTYFHVQDHLGSARLLTAMNQSVAQNLDYYPFGQLNSSDSGVTTHEFTGDEYDSETGLDHMDFRQYSPSQGRWITPDPAGLTAIIPQNPQSWNRYAYVLNNPLRFVDLNGLDCAYLNDAGTGVEDLDHHSDIGECEANGGYWANGWIPDFSSVQTNPFNDNATIYTVLNGQGAVSIANPTWTQGAFYPNEISVGLSNALVNFEPWIGNPYTNNKWLDRLGMHPITFSFTLPVFGPVGPTFTGAIIPGQNFGCFGTGLGLSLGASADADYLPFGRGNPQEVLQGPSWNSSAYAPWGGGGGLTTNSSGTYLGPGMGIPGVSASRTHSWCGTLAPGS